MIYVEIVRSYILFARKTYTKTNTAVLFCHEEHYKLKCPLHVDFTKVNASYSMAWVSTTWAATSRSEDVSGLK